MRWPVRGNHVVGGYGPVSEALCLDCYTRRPWAVRALEMDGDHAGAFALLEEGIENMKITESKTPGACRAMRCGSPATETIHATNGETAIEVEACGRHAAQARKEGIELRGVDYAPAIDVAPAETPAEGPEPTPAEEAQGAEAEALAALEIVRTTEITTRADLEAVTEVLGEVKAKAKALEAREKEITRPMREALDSVRALFKPARVALSTIEAEIKSRIAAFVAREDERNREAARLAADAIAAGDAEAAGEALAAVHSAGNLADQGVSLRGRWAFEVTDEAAVPRELCSPDPRLIKALISDLGDEAGAFEIPGVRVYRETSVAYRGKS